MSTRIDLAELSAREGERVEWKENVADIADVVKTICAFSNDFANMGGGYLVCGAAEGRDAHGFQKVELDPRFEIEPESVLTILPANPRHQSLAKI